MKKLQLLLFTLALFLGATMVSTGQVTIPYTFSPATTIKSAEVNSNFSALGTKALDRTGGTISGTISVTGTIGSSGGTLSGSWAGSPTFSGVVTCVTCAFYDTYSAKTATFAPAAESFYTCDATGGAVTVNLPATATAGAGRIYNVKKIDSSVNACTLDGNASETIDGSTTVAISVQYQSLTVVSTGTAWFIK